MTISRPVAMLEEAQKLAMEAVGTNNQILEMGGILPVACDDFKGTEERTDVPLARRDALA